METRLAAEPFVEGRYGGLPSADEHLVGCSVVVVVPGCAFAWGGKVVRGTPFISLAPFGVAPSKPRIFYPRPAMLRVLVVEELSWSELQLVRSWQSRGLPAFSVYGVRGQKIGIRTPERPRNSEAFKPPEPPVERDFGMAAPPDEVDDELDAIGG